MGATLTAWKVTLNGFLVALRTHKNGFVDRQSRVIFLARLFVVSITKRGDYASA